MHFAIAFVFSILTVNSWAIFLCPPAQDIYPCECLTHPKKIVRCDGMASLTTVHAALTGHFSETIPRLQLTHLHSFSIPPYALGDVSPRRLILRDSNIRKIDNDAFRGQNSLGLLILAADRIEEIPTEPLKRLSDLQTLSLAGNFLMKIQEESLSSLMRLRFLILSDNRISEVQKNSFPENLEFLALSRNLLSTLNGSLQNLTHLEELLVTDNRLTNVKGEFGGLDNLKQLFLDRNHLVDISDSFTELKSITSLSLSDNRISEVGGSLSSLARLKHLNLSHNYITELHPKLFLKMKELESLDLSGNYIKYICATLTPMKWLRELRLSDMNLGNLEADCFSGMNFLESLDLSHNRLTTAEPDFRHPLPSLVHLRLNDNKLSMLKHNSKNLRKLDISFNNFSSFKGLPVMNNRGLTTLKITGNPWKCTDHVSKTLRDLQQKGVDVQGRPRC